MSDERILDMDDGAVTRALRVIFANLPGDAVEASRREDAADLLAKLGGNDLLELLLSLAIARKNGAAGIAEPRIADQFRREAADLLNWVLRQEADKAKQPRRNGIFG